MKTTTIKSDSKQKIENEFFASRVQNTKVILGDKLLSVIDEVADVKTYSDQPRKLEKSIVANKIAQLFFTTGHMVFYNERGMARVMFDARKKMEFGIFSLCEKQSSLFFSFTSGMMNFHSSIEVAKVKNKPKDNFGKISAYCQLDNFGIFTITTD